MKNSFSLIYSTFHNNHGQQEATHSHMQWLNHTKWSATSITAQWQSHFTFLDAFGCLEQKWQTRRTEISDSRFLQVIAEF